MEQAQEPLQQRLTRLSARNILIALNQEHALKPEVAAAYRAELKRRRKAGTLGPSTQAVADFLGGEYA